MDKQVIETIPNILNYIHTMENGEILLFNILYLNNCFLLLYLLKDLNTKLKLIPQLCFNIKECKVVLFNNT